MSVSHVRSPAFDTRPNQTKIDGREGRRLPIYWMFLDVIVSMLFRTINGDGGWSLNVATL